MDFRKTSSRTFLINPEPTVADPAWVMPIVETTDGVARVVTFKQISELIQDVNDKQIAYAAEAKGRDEILRMFDITPQQYFDQRHKTRIINLPL